MSCRESCWIILGLPLLLVAGCGEPSSGDEQADPLAACGPEIGCSGHGACAVSFTGPVCLCDPGYLPVGAECIVDTDVDPCRQVPCSGHGSCVPINDQPVCACESGYHTVGLECIEDADDPCLDVACSGHGTCATLGVDSLCLCEAGYQAQQLACVELEILDPCQNVACSGHGTCALTAGQAVCACEEGYRAVELECVTNPGEGLCDGETCSGHGTCGAGGGGPVCVCEPGYHPLQLDCVADVLVPEACVGVDCSGHGTCGVGPQQDPVCVCDDGHHPQQLRCVLDAVIAGPCDGIDCSGHGTCGVGVALNPVCVCDSGYHPQQLDCVADEVPEEPCDGILCSGHGSCGVADGEPVCGCEQGYSCSGTSCLAADPLAGAVYFLRIHADHLGADGVTRLPVLAIGQNGDGTPAVEEVVLSLSNPGAGVITPARALLSKTGFTFDFIPCRSAEDPACLGPFRVQLARASDPAAILVVSDEIRLVEPLEVGTPAPCLVGGNVAVLEYEGERPLTIRQGQWYPMLFRSESPTTVGAYVNYAGSEQLENMEMMFSSEELDPPFLGVGRYEDAQWRPFAEPGHPGLDIEAWACGELSGRFQIYEFRMEDDHLQSLTVTFDQRCRYGSRSVRGCLHFEL